MADLLDGVDSNTGARFSPCGAYRYTLWRRWRDGPMMMWLMLNPSTADACHNDPTVERCQNRAYRAGYAGLIVCNLFGLRATDPDGLYQVDDPVGPDNDAAILASGHQAARIICAWGNHGGSQQLGDQAGNLRSEVVIRLLHGQGWTLYALSVTQQGEPGHPLYIAYSTQPRPMATGTLHDVIASGWRDPYHQMR